MSKNTNRAYIGTRRPVDEEGGTGPKPRSQSGWEQAEEIEETNWSTVRQKDASETEVNICITVIKSAMLHGAETRATTNKQEKGIEVYHERDENGTTDVRSDMQRHDQERTHPRNNLSDAGFQNDHGETIELR